MKRAILMLIGLLLFHTSELKADTVNDEAEMNQQSKLETTLDIKDALNYAFIHNPRIDSARASWKQVLEDYRIKTGYPDPQLMLTYFPAPIETRLGPQDWNLNLSQSLPFPGKLSQKGEIVESEIKIARLNLDKTIRQVYTDIIISYQELYYIQQAVRTAEKNLALAEKLMIIGESSYADNQAGFYDVSKAQAQVAQVHYDILLLEELERTEKIKINSLLNRPPQARLGGLSELKYRPVIYNLKEVLAIFLNTQEDMQIAKEKISRSEAQIELSRMDRLPDFKVGLFYAGIGEPDVANPPRDAGDDAVGIQFGVNIPLWSGKNKGKIEKAIAEKRKSLAQQDQTANQGRAKISRAWFKLQNSHRLIELYQNTLIPQVLKSVETAETWYREGQGSFSDFLEVQATAYNYQVSLERAKADYSQTLARLELLVGIPLDRKSDQSDSGGQS